jgi:TRAP-type mannitol/chloroaromatic compound transport system substrate-binding protein
LCDYDINDIIKANDPKNLKIIIDKILKKMNLDLQNEYIEFQKKVIETLESHFSVFMQFQAKVIEALNQIGIPQIQEISLDYYQVLNDAEVEEDIKEVKQQIVDEDLI